MTTTLWCFVLYSTKNEVFFTADLVTFTEEILNGKLKFFVQCFLFIFVESIASILLPSHMLIKKIHA